MTLNDDTDHGKGEIILDQNVTLNELYRSLEQTGFRVTRKRNIKTIPDDEIRDEARRRKALIITRDGGFTGDPNTLVYPFPDNGPKQRLRDHVPDIVETVEYIFGLVHDIPQCYRSKMMGRYGELCEGYVQQVEMLRQKFGQNGNHNGVVH